MPADDDVVPDLHEIINFRALADHRILKSAAVDGCIGANFDVVLDDDPPDLRHLQVAAGPMAKPKPSWPIRTPEWMMTRSPTSAWVTVASAPM